MADQEGCPEELMDAEVIQLQAQDQTAAADANALAQEQAAARRLVVPRWKAAEAAHPGDGPPTAAAAVARPTSTTRTTRTRRTARTTPRTSRRWTWGGFGESDRPRPRRLTWQRVAGLSSGYVRLEGRAGAVGDA